MDRITITFPDTLLKLLSFDWQIDWRGQSLGASTDGVTRTVYNAFPRWIGSPKIFLTRELIAPWRALRSMAQGQVGIYRIPISDPAVFWGPLFDNGIPWSNDQLWDNGSGWLYDPVCVSSSAAAAGATMIRIDTSANGITPTIGQIMSHNDWPFVVIGAFDRGSGVYDLDIQPPLRAAIASGDEISLRGWGQFEAVEEGMGNPAYNASHVSSPDLTFREVLSR